MLVQEVTCEEAASPPRISSEGKGVVVWEAVGGRITLSVSHVEHGGGAMNTTRAKTRNMDWRTFKMQFKVSATLAEISGHFDGSVNMPKKPETGSEPKGTYREELVAW